MFSFINDFTYSANDYKVESNKIVFFKNYLSNKKLIKKMINEIKISSKDKVEALDPYYLFIYRNYLSGTSDENPSSAKSLEIYDGLGNFLFETNDNVSSTLGDKVICLN